MHNTRQSTLDVISYRGPQQPGGVSALLQAALRNQANSRWLYVRNSQIGITEDGNSSYSSSLTKELIDGHYRYSNEFLWPLLHGLAHHAVFDQRNHTQYYLLNMIMAMNCTSGQSARSCFIHDYQFALLPNFLPHGRAAASTFFLHIPWPDSCPEEYRPHLAQLAKSMLRCRNIGFHTQRYVTNFLTFVDESFPEYAVDARESIIVDPEGRIIEIIAKPAGIDSDFWQRSANTRANPITPLPYILSVGRADYTKGIVEQIAAVDLLFRTKPELREKLQIVLISQPTRSGIEAFDSYWDICQSRYQELLVQHATPSWKPLMWLTEPVPPDQLAPLYKNAAAMLVAPKVDGLNLTAKEYIAASSDFAGSLILTQGAGVWEEFKDHVIRIESCTPEMIAGAMIKSCEQPISGAQTRQLKRLVHSNSISKWWRSLVEASQEQDGSLYVTNA